MQALDQIDPNSLNFQKVHIVLYRNVPQNSSYYKLNIKCKTSHRVAKPNQRHLIGNVESIKR
jgi:hypothetical protein